MKIITLGSNIFSKNTRPKRKIHQTKLVKKRSYDLPNGIPSTELHATCEQDLQNVYGLLSAPLTLKSVLCNPLIHSRVSSYFTLNIHHAKNLITLYKLFMR